MQQLQLNGGLSTSLHPSVIPDGYLSECVNASTERGILEAGPGYADFWHQTWGFDPADRVVGAGLAIYGSATEILLIVKVATNVDYPGKCKLFVCNTATGAMDESGTQLWSNLDNSPWHFQSFGEYIYAINDTDGMYRRKVGVVGSWERAPMKFEYATVADGSAEFDVPAPAYPVASWNVGDYAGTIALYSPGLTFEPTAAAVVNNELELSNAGNIGTARVFGSWFVYTFSTAQDFTDRRYLQIPVRTESIGAAPWDDTRVHEEPRLAFDTGTLEVYVSDNPAAAPGSWSTQWRKAKIKAVYEESMPNPNASPNWFVKAQLWIDLDEAYYGSAVLGHLSAIKKIAINVPVSSGNDYKVILGAPVEGGVFLNKPVFLNYMSFDLQTGLNFDNPEAYYATTLKDIDYIITGYDAGKTPTETPGTNIRVAASDGCGVPLAPGLPPLGARTKLALVSPDPTYARIRVYRRRGEQWHRIYDQPQGTDPYLIDDRVEADDDLRDWNELATYPIGHDFGTTYQNLTGAVMCAWKGHLAVGSGREVYVSYYENPGLYVLPFRSSPVGAAITDRPDMGATGYLADDLSDTVVSVISSDHLYGIGQKGVYVSIGDSALEATPFRRMPGTYGALHAKAACAHLGGILVGTKNGLRYYRAHRAAFSSAEVPYEELEVTKDVRGTWDLLLSAGGNHPLIVRSYRDEILCFKGVYYLRRTRSGRWQFGKLDGATLHTGQVVASGSFGFPIAMPAGKVSDKGESNPASSLAGQFGIDYDQQNEFLADVIVDELGGHVYLVSATGYLHRFGDQYKTFANKAIAWFAALPARVDFEQRSIVDIGLLVDNGEAFSNTSHVRFVADSNLGRDGSKRVTADIKATNVRQPDIKTSQAFQLQIAVGATTAAHQVISIGVALNQTGRSGGR